LSGYYLAFNGRLGRLVMDYELQQAGALSPAEAARAEDDGYPHAHLRASLDAADAAPAAAADQGPAASASAAAAAPAKADGEFVFSSSDLSKSWDEFASAPKAAPAVPEAPVASAKPAAAEAKAAGLEAGSAGEALAAAAVGDIGGAAGALKELATGAAPVAGAAPAAGAAGAAGRGPARRVLVGHSLGGACAALEAIAHAADYAALVLVAPAILVGFGAGGGKASWLEQLHDDSALTRAHGAAASAAAAGGGNGGGGGSTDLDQELRDAAEAAGGLAPRSSLGASPPAGSAAPAAPQKLGGSGGYTAKVPGSEVAYYMARGMPEIKVAAPPSGLIGKFMAGIMSVMQVGGDGRGSWAGGPWERPRMCRLCAPAGPLCCRLSPVVSLRQCPQPSVGAPSRRVLFLRTHTPTPPYPPPRAAPSPLATRQTTMISAVVALILLLRPMVLLGLRAAVRSRDFWKSTLQQAYYDKNKVSPGQAWARPRQGVCPNEYQKHSSAASTVSDEATPQHPLPGDA
jgi:hypothetical protein